MYLDTKRASMYVNRRQKLLEQIDEGIALIDSSGMAAEYAPAALDKHIEYLTGLKSAHTCLLLAPRGVTVGLGWDTLRGPEMGRGRRLREVLFVEGQSEHEKAYEGEGPAMEEIRRATGVEAIYGLSKLNEVLQEALMREEVLWLNTAATPRLDAPLTPDIVRINEIKERFYWVRFKNIASRIHQIRLVKDSYEIACLRKAFEITTEIVETLMRTIKPGDNESLGQAIFDYEWRKRIDNASFSDLARTFLTFASGKNAVPFHYSASNQVIKDGDLILVDAGLAYNGYCSDITRTFPANGRFTARQKELYSILLEAQELALEKMRPGFTPVEAHRVVYDHLEKHKLAQYGYGRCGHPVGLTVHDTSFRECDGPFEPGMVAVIEPFITIAHEGIVIRIEDGVVITEDGHELLPGPPKGLEEVETFCSNS